MLRTDPAHRRDAMGLLQPVKQASEDDKQASEHELLSSSASSALGADLTERSPQQQPPLMDAERTEAAEPDLSTRMDLPAGELLLSA